MNLLLLYRTLKHLRWEQLIYRPIRTAQFRLYRAAPVLTRRWRDTTKVIPSPDTRVVRVLRALLEDSFLHLKSTSGSGYESPMAIEENRFTFLNRTLRIDQIDWNERYESHLWNYHLHYFGWLIDPARRFAGAGDDRPMRAGQRLIESWMRNARIGVSDGWDAYPTSLRAVNWIYAYALIAERWSDRAFLQSMIASLHSQLDFLRRHLELHLQANHLLKNIKALVIGGIFFGESKWIDQGVRLLRRELDEQVLDDGGHYERSPMYHAQALADFMECYALLKETGRISDPGEIESRLCGMTGFLEAMTCPDGSLALFNDAANTAETRPLPLIAASEKICGYRKNSAPPPFPDTGYFLWISDDRRERMTVDAGEPAVAYNTAHAHCDLLSYELWLDGHPLVVDSGVHGYGGDRFREYCRSTRAHNTVMFDGIEQSEVWSTFRMGRRAEIVNASVEHDPGRWVFNGAFRRYLDNLVHERRIERLENGAWIVTDAVREGSARSATSFVHLHPDVEIESIDAENLSVTCRRGDHRYRIQAFGSNGVTVIQGEMHPVQGWRFPDFGIALSSPAISFFYRVERGSEFGYSLVRT